MLVGLSGGADSVALTLLLRDLSRHDGFSLVGLGHVNHRLRPTAPRDEQFCREFAERLGLPITVESVDVTGYAAAQGLSTEDAARRLRYESLHRAATAAGAEQIAVGHTRDDQAETFLLKLIRGAGLTGLGGIHPRRGQLIRPLLDVGRAELRTFLASRGESWMEDETNQDVENPRNRIRHRVLPELDLAYGAETSPAIARAAALVREEDQWLDEVSARRVEALVARSDDGLRISADALGAEPVALRRRIILKALRLAAPDRQFGLTHVDAVFDVVAGDSAGADLPGVRVELRRGKLVLQSRRVDAK